MPQTERLVFLNSQIFAMTLAATAQRSMLYAAELTERERRPFQVSLKAALESCSRQYLSSVPESRHVENIVRLGNDLSTRHPELLNAGRMRIGHAQKALNLYLKYLWCIGRTAEPPHCPIDSIILKKVPGHAQTRWTQLVAPAQYMQIIAAAKEQASTKGLSLAEWELLEYNRRDA